MNVCVCVFQCVGVFYLVSLYVLHVCGPAWSDINNRNENDDDDDDDARSLSNRPQTAAPMLCAAVCERTRGNILSISAGVWK